MRCNEGGSSIELMICISIFLLMVSVSSASLPAAGWLRTDYEAGRIQSELRLCRELSKGQYFNADPRFRDKQMAPEMKLYVDGDGLRLCQGIKVIRRYKVPERMVMRSSRSIIQFGWDGATQGTTAAISLQDGRTVRYIIVDSAGRIRVSDAPPEGGMKN